MSGYDFSQEAANELLERADKRNDELLSEVERLRAGLLEVIAADQVYGHREPGSGPGWHDGELAKIARCYMLPNAELRGGHG